MARDWLSIGSRWNRRVYLGVVAVVSTAGCQSTDRDDSFSSLDARTRQMLLAPAGGSLKAPPQQYAMTDPAATGATGITPSNSFNRGMPAQPTYTAQNDPKSQNSYAVMPNTTGVVQAGVSAPTPPPYGATMPLQPKIQQAYATSPINPAPMNNVPPVEPTTPAPAQPPVNVIATTAPQPSIIPASPYPTPEIVSPAMPTIIAVAPPAMPSVVTPAAPESPKATGGLVPVFSPVDQPPTGFGVVSPQGALK